MNDSSIRYITPDSAAGLKTLVTKAISSYGKARVAVQVAIVAILCHAAKHHDYSQATALVDGLGKTKTARDVVKFFTDFGGLKTVKKVDEKTGEEITPDGFNDWQGSDYIAEHLDDAKATMFWEYSQSRESVFKVYSVEEMARQFVNGVANARKRAANGKAEIRDDLSETTMQSVLNLVKFESIAKTGDNAKDEKPARKSAAA